MKLSTDKGFISFFRENEDIGFVILLFLLSLGISWPLLRNMFPATYDHNASFPYHMAMRHFFGHGQLLPVWVPDLNQGFGGALFNFYPPLFFFLSASIDALGIPSALAINIASILVVFFSAWAMFVFLKELINIDGAFLGASAYMLAPYHIFDLYKRGVYAELTSFIFLPLIFWGIRKVIKEPRFYYFAATAWAIAGLLLSHMVMSVFLLPLTGIYFIYEGLAQSGGKLRKLGIALAAVLAGFSLAAFSILPAIVEKKYLNVKQFVTLWFDYHSHFVNPVQLLLSPEKYSSWLDINLADKQPFEFGWFYLIGLGVGVACVAFWASKETKKVYFLFFLALLSTLWMMTQYSKTIWEMFPTLALMQFPWRLLEPASFFVSAFIACIGFFPWRNYRRILCMLVVAFIVFTRLPDLKPLDWLPPVSNPSQSSKLIQQTGGDFKPVAAKYNLSKNSDNLMDIPEGSGEIISHQQQSPVAHTFQVFVQTQAIACFYNYYFPGWEVDIDGQKVKLIDNDYDVLLFAVAPGWHKINVHFSPTPVRTIGLLITLACLLGMIVLGGSKLIAKAKQEKGDDNYAKGNIV